MRERDWSWLVGIEAGGAGYGTKEGRGKNGCCSLHEEEMAYAYIIWFLKLYEIYLAQCLPKNCEKNGMDCQNDI